MFQGKMSEFWVVWFSKSWFVWAGKGFRLTKLWGHKSVLFDWQRQAFAMEGNDLLGCLWCYRGCKVGCQETCEVVRLGLRGGCKVVSCKVGSRGTPLGGVDPVWCPPASCFSPSPNEGWQYLIRSSNWHFFHMLLLLALTGALFITLCQYGSA